jgi:hypothetical protein
MIIATVRKEGEFRESLKETDWAWLAGFIDGEGHLGIKKAYATNNHKHHAWSQEGWWWYGPRVSVHNTHLPAMERAAFMLNANIQQRKMQEYNLIPMYSVEVASRQELQRLLPMLIPFLFIKRDLAESILKLVSLPRGSGPEKEEAYQAYQRVVILSQAGRVKRLPEGATVRTERKR